VASVLQPARICAARQVNRTGARRGRRENTQRSHLSGPSTIDIKLLSAFVLCDLCGLLFYPFLEFNCLLAAAFAALGSLWQFCSFVSACATSKSVSGVLPPRERRHQRSGNLPVIAAPSRRSPGAAPWINAVKDFSRARCASLQPESTCRSGSLSGPPINRSHGPTVPRLAG